MTNVKINALTSKSFHVKYLNLPTWPQWILLKFCQLNAFIKKWKSWKFYHFFTCSSEIATTWNMDLLAWIPLKFLVFWNCFYSAIFNRKHLKFGQAIHFHTNLKTMYLVKNFIKQVCGRMLKLLKLLLWCFPSIFREPEVDKEESKYSRTHCGNTLPKFL